MASTGLLKTAHTDKNRCTICGRYNKSAKLVDIKPDSIVYAYLHHKILIKPGQGVRCCQRHTDNNGLIQTHEFMNMRTKVLEYSRFSILMFDYLAKNISSSKPIGILDKFNDMDSISDDYCMQITGWKKREFNNFSRYITSIYDTVGRSKEVMIALYRYWLRKGTDEETLALLITGTTQQQVSHYLDQIRKAITTDFVPFFLGANKGRDFFCGHKNESIKELHQLSDNDLVICADATYCRIEKSSNNQFQYDSWSQQKLDSLLKPFLVCCGDGYIIDCYGPFKAHQNDAKIFDYILENDRNLVDIIEPKKTVCFVDRGK